MPLFDDEFKTVDADAPEETTDVEETLDAQPQAEAVDPSLSSMESDTEIARREAMAKFLAGYVNSGASIQRFFDNLNPNELRNIGADLVAKEHIKPTDIGAHERDTSSDIRKMRDPTGVAQQVRALISKLMS